jgi:hypothetical protein
MYNGGFNDINPAFPPSSTPDFLNSLSQMGEQLGADLVPGASGDSKLNSDPGSHGGAGAGSDHLPPRTPMDGQGASQPLCHPKTPGTPSAVHTPQTPSLCNPLNNAPGSNNPGSNPGSHHSNNPGSVHTPGSSHSHGTPKGTAPSPSVPPTPSSNDLPSSVPPASHASDLPTDLNFDPAAIIDGDGGGQESLDVSSSSQMSAYPYLLFLTVAAGQHW